MTAQTDPVVRLEDISKRYGDTVALDGLSMQVRRGTIHCLVGPNGAGKTTAVECIEGLRTPDRGTVRILGLDPVRDRLPLYHRMGVQLQESGLPDRLKVRELIRLFASLYEHPADGDMLLRRLALDAKRDAAYGNLSGGQKLRLHITLALIGDPELVILDEPTSGLDPQARYHIWELLSDIRDAGVTVLVTTHYLEEAEEHGDWVVIVDNGRVVASDSPAALLTGYGLGTRVAVPAGACDAATLEQDARVSRTDRAGERLLVYGRDRDVYDAVRQVCRESKFTPEMRTARLEDLFLLLTGREYREEGT